MAGRWGEQQQKRAKGWREKVARGSGGDVWKSSPMGEQRERGRRGKRRSQPE